MDASVTKALVTGLILLLYTLALGGRRITPVHIALAIGYLLAGFRLGYDTLMYRMLLEEGRLDHYGVVWALFERLYNVTGVWWIVHATILTLITWPIAVLANRTPWPTLALAMFITLPGLGFDYLSLLRQALATALVIVFHLQASRRAWFGAAVAGAAAYLAHPAAGFALVILLFFHLRHDVKRLIIGSAAVAMALAVVIFAAPDFAQSQISNIGFLFARYLITDAVIENDSGLKLAMFWAFILTVPVLLQAVVRPKSILQAPFLVTLSFVILYGVLVTVSGSSVRLVWLLLPIVLAMPLSALVQPGPPYLINLCRGVVVAVCASAAIYVVQIAPEHYWVGEYPHEVHFAPE